MTTATDFLWTYDIANNNIELGPTHTLTTDSFRVVVYKAKGEDEVYHIRISKRGSIAKAIYESRFDSFYKGHKNPNVVKEIALAKLSRFSI